MPIGTTTANLTTTDDTTTTLVSTRDTAPFSGLSVQFSFFIHAHEPATGDQKLWAIRTIRNDPDDSITTVNMHSSTGDAGASAWAVEIINNGSGVDVDVTGEVSHTINWVVYIQQSA